MNLNFIKKLKYYKYSRIYTNDGKFSKIAKDEGFPEIANAYDLIAKVEAEHEKTFNKIIKCSKYR